MFTGLSHISIVVPDLDAAARRLRETYGLTVGETRTNAEQGVHLAYVELGNARIELMAPASVAEELGDAAAEAAGRHEYLVGFELKVESVANTRELLHDIPGLWVQPHRLIVPASPAFNTTLVFAEAR